MHRFSENRLWAHILALSLVLGSMAGVAGNASAADRNAISRPALSGRVSGDPDATGGTGREDGFIRPDARLRGTTGGSVGDGAAVMSRWMGTLRFAWRIAQTRWLR